MARTLVIGGTAPAWSSCSHAETTSSSCIARGVGVADFFGGPNLDWLSGDARGDVTQRTPIAAANNQNQQRRTEKWLRRKTF